MDSRINFIWPSVGLTKRHPARMNGGMKVALPKFTKGAKVRLQYEGRNRNGVVTEVSEGLKRGARREYLVTATSNGADLGWYSSRELQAR